jgi:hypothetical protein
MRILKKFSKLCNTPCTSFFGTFYEHCQEITFVSSSVAGVLDKLTSQLTPLSGVTAEQARQST